MTPHSETGLLHIFPRMSKYGLKPKGDYDAVLLWTEKMRTKNCVSKYGLKPKGDYDSSSSCKVKTSL